MKEAQLEAKIVAHCRLHGVWCRKFSSPNARGVPDRILAKNGKVMFLEIKAEGKRPTALQFREMGILVDHGVLAVWVDDYHDAVERIDDFFAGDGV